VFGANQFGPRFDSVLDFKNRLRPACQSPSSLPLVRAAGRRQLPLLCCCMLPLRALERRVLEHPDPSFLITPSSLQLYLVGQVSAQRKVLPPSPPTSVHRRPAATSRPQSPKPSCECAPPSYSSPATPHRRRPTGHRVFQLFPISVSSATAAATTDSTSPVSRLSAFLVYKELHLIPHLSEPFPPPLSSRFFGLLRRRPPPSLGHRGQTRQCPLRSDFLRDRLPRGPGKPTDHREPRVATQSELAT
jgi:hypothetical protein